MTEATNSHSLKLLTKSIIGKLENNKVIVFNPTQRTSLGDQLFNTLARVVLTEDDLNQKVRDQVTAASDSLSDSKLTETEAFQSQKRALKSQLGEHQLHGFYFQEPVRGVASKVRKFLFDCSLVEDVFESDETIEKIILETIQSFDEKKIS